MTIIYQKNRAYSLVVGDTRTGEGFEIANDLNISFDVNKSSSNKDRTNNCVIELYNLSKEKQKWLENEFIGVVLSAGYHDTAIKRLFAGQTTSITTRKNGTDTVTQIQLGSGYVELNHVTVSKVVPEGKTIKEVITELSKEIPGVSRTVFNGVNINSKVLDGYPLSGSNREVLDELAKAHELDWQLDDGVLYVHDSSGASTNDLNTAFVISRTTGMVNRPYAVSGDVRRTKKDPVKKGGVQVQILLNPEIVPGSIVKIEDENFEGYFKVSSLRSYGEWRGQDWYTDLRLEKLTK